MITEINDLKIAFRGNCLVTFREPCGGKRLLMKLNGREGWNSCEISTDRTVDNVRSKKRPRG